MRFYSKFERYEKNIPFNSVSGTMYKDEYSYEVSDGVQCLVKSGKTNVYDMIQSYADSQDINNIIQRFLNTGDTSKLDCVHGFYADLSNAPSTFAEVFERVQQAENVFNSLSSDVKKAFDNDYRKFWSSYGTKDFEDIINPIIGNNETVRVDAGITDPVSKESEK